MVPRWAAEDIIVRNVKLFYPFKAATAAANNANLIIQCRKFIPYEWDVLIEPWTIGTGEIIDLQSSPFTCVRTCQSIPGRHRLLSSIPVTRLIVSASTIWMRASPP